MTCRSPRWGCSATGVADLADRPRVHVLGFEDLWLRVFAEAGIAACSDGLTLDISVAAIEVAAATAMAAIVPERFARGALAAGRVTRAVDVLVPMRQSHYVLWPERSAPSSEALTFMRWLGELDPTTEA